MASLNKIMLIGHLGRDPEHRYLDSGMAVASVTVATSERWKDKQTGDVREHTEWHRVQFFDRLADVANEYLRKGSLVYVEGSLRTRKYNDKDGIERSITEVRADRLTMLGGRRDDGEGQGAPQQRQAPAQRPQAQPQQRQQAPARQASGDDRFMDMSDDVPF